jgi:hypothetical protein
MKGVKAMTRVKDGRRSIRAVDLTARLRRARLGDEGQKQERICSFVALVSGPRHPIAGAAAGGRQIDGALSRRPSSCSSCAS